MPVDHWALGAVTGASITKQRLSGSLGLLQYQPGLRSSAIAPDNPSPPIAVVWPTSGTFMTFDTMTGSPDSLLLTVTILVAFAPLLIAGYLWARTGARCASRPRC